MASVYLHELQSERNDNVDNVKDTLSVFFGVHFDDCHRCFINTIYIYVSEKWSRVKDYKQEIRGSVCRVENVNSCREMGEKGQTK